MKDARGLDVTSNDAAAVAAADDFAARLLRLDQGVEAILDAAKRWPDTPIVQLYAAAFWLYGQTDGALKNAAAHLRAGDALAMNARERALHRALTLWHGNDNLRAVEALEAITTEWPSDLLTAKIAEFLYYVLGQQYMGPRFRAHMRRLEGAHAGDPDFLAMTAFASELCGDSPPAPRPRTDCRCHARARAPDGARTRARSSRARRTRAGGRPRSRGHRR